MYFPNLIQGMIVGYHVSDSLRAEANMIALKMAIKKNGAPLIHHSDRGSQYIYKKYIQLLKSHNSLISMGETALDNAYAERINLTIKSEYLDYWKPKNFEDLKRKVKKAVNYYNLKRPHNAINRMTPHEFEKKVVNLPQHDRPKVIIYTDGLKNKGGIEPHFVFSTINPQAHNCPINLVNRKIKLITKTVNSI